jgi:hypothetical protein
MQRGGGDRERMMREIREVVMRGLIARSSGE